MRAPREAPSVASHAGRLAVQAVLVAAGCALALLIVRFGGINVIAQSSVDSVIHPIPDEPALLLSRHRIDPAHILNVTSLPASDAPIVREAHRLDPLDPAPFIANGLIAKGQGDEARALASFEAARRRDPRLYLPRFALMREHLLGGRYPAAVDEIISAVNLRADQSTTLFSALLMIQNTPNGRPMVLSAVDRFPQTRRRMAVFVSSLKGQDTLLDALLERDIDADTRAAVISNVAQRGDYTKAYALWRGRAGSGSSNVFDSGLDGLSAPQPFGWKIGSDSNLTAAFARDGSDDAHLSVNVFGIVTANIVQQTLLLPAGSYRLVAKGQRVSTQDGDPSRFHWDLSCLGTAQPIASVAMDVQTHDPQTRSAAVEIPAGCTAQSLSLGFTPTDEGTTNLRMRFDSISIEPRS